MKMAAQMMEAVVWGNPRQGFRMFARCRQVLQGYGHLVCGNVFIIKVTDTMAVQDWEVREEIRQKIRSGERVSCPACGQPYHVPDFNMLGD